MDLRQTFQRLESEVVVDKRFLDKVLPEVQKEEPSARFIYYYRGFAVIVYPDSVKPCEPAGTCPCQPPSLTCTSRVQDRDASDRSPQESPRGIPLDPVVKAARIIINDLGEVITRVLEDTWPLERFGVPAGITMDEDTIDKVLACIRKDEPSVRLMASEDCLEVTADPRNSE